MISLIIVGILIALGLVLHFISAYRPLTRQREIKEVIADLEALEKREPKYKEVAEMNIGFFKAARSIFSFIYWLIFTAPKLRRERERILELADLPIEKWQKLTHERFIRLQRRRFPGILKPFVQELSKVILRVKETKTKKEPITILDLGFGGGELGRQLFNKLPDVPLIYIGVDNSPAIVEASKQEFKPLDQETKIVFRELPGLKDKIVDSLWQEANNHSTTKMAAVWCGNILDIDKHLSPGKIDIICHTRTFHHLNSQDKIRFIEMCQRLAPVTVEMDDHNCLFFIFSTILATWVLYPDPLCMNGSILSCLRDPLKEELTGHFKLLPPVGYVRLILKDYLIDHQLIEGFRYKS